MVFLLLAYNSYIFKPLAIEKQGRTGPDFIPAIPEENIAVEVVAAGHGSPLIANDGGKLAGVVIGFSRIYFCFPGGA